MKPFFLLLTLASQFLGFSSAPMSDVPQPVSETPLVRYVALGDSYTIGEGVAEFERWPNVLVEHLQDDGFQVELVANPSQTGWTTQQLLDREIPILQASDADVVSVMIGVNDYFQGVPEAVFQERFLQVLDAVQAELEDPSQVLVVTIPDYSLTPTGSRFGGGDVSAGIAGFNTFILEQATIRGLPVVDVFALSQEVVSRPEWVASDGLHPSAAQYRAWEELIFPKMKALLQR